MSNTQTSADELLEILDSNYELPYDALELRRRLLHWHNAQLATVLNRLLEQHGTYISIDDNNPHDATPTRYIQAELGKVKGTK